MITKLEQEQVLKDISGLINYLTIKNKGPYLRAVRMLLQDNIILQKKLEEKEKVNEQPVTE